MQASGTHGVCETDSQFVILSKEKGGMSTEKLFTPMRLRLKMKIF